MVQRKQVTVTWAGFEGALPLEVAYLEDGPADGPLAVCLHGFPDHAPAPARVNRRIVEFLTADP
jgi:pimeloyl-ACP methyl ester carboxylesterase